MTARSVVHPAALITMVCLLTGLPEAVGAEQGPRPTIVRTSAARATSAGASSNASRPTIATDGARATSATSASIDGNGDPEGQLTKVRADWGLAHGRWCASRGTQGKPSKTGPQTLGSGNAMISEVLVKLDGLTPGAEYCAELLARNRSGTSHGGLVSFATPDEAARAISRPASPAQGPPSHGSGGWPTTVIITVTALGAILLGGLATLALPRLRARRDSSARPAAG